MLRLRLARARALTGCAFVALAAGLAGCATTTASTSSVHGHALTIYASRPPGTLAPEAEDVALAEQLAVNRAGGRVGNFTVKLVPIAGNELSDNARGAIADSTTIAYLGELEPGTSAQTLGITNAQQVLQVSPTDTAAELTQKATGVAGAPDRYYESLSTYGRTFARVAPTDALEAKALTGEMQKLGVRRLYIASDGGAYGRAFRSAVVGDATGAGITLESAPTGADGVLYAGSSTSGATQVFNQAASSARLVKLFAPSALATSSFALGLSPAAQRGLYTSSPGFMSSDLPVAGRQFVAAFKTAYGHTPAADAVFGYEAAGAVLDVLRRAGASAGNRGTVVHDFFAIRNRDSALGTYSINKDGDIVFASGAPFVFSEVKGGRLVPVRAVQEQG